MPELVAEKPMLSTPLFAILSAKFSGGTMSDKQHDLMDLRREYVAQGLDNDQLHADPVAQFSAWFDVACKARPDDASSMALATADAQGKPSVRIVLLKHFDANGFAWYTDYESQKGQELAQNPQAELLFYWYGLERQVRIQGRVEKLTAAEADLYFHKRPLGSQLSAAVSHQSQPVATRQTLETAVAALEANAGGVIPCPERWGGYRLIPEKFEFWQGRENRLHDRFRFMRHAEGWTIDRLQP